MSQTSPIVVLEGPDGGGKTTLANILSEQLNVQVLHTGPPPEGISAKDQYLSMIMNQRTQYMGAVFDRFHLGERIYGPITRGIDTLGDEGQRLVELGLNQLRARQIICVPPLEACLANWRTRKGIEYVEDEDKIIDIWYKYRLIKTSLPTIRYDYTSDNLADALYFAGVEV